MPLLVYSAGDGTMCVTYARVWSVTGQLWVFQIDTEIVWLHNQIELSIIETSHR